MNTSELVQEIASHLDGWQFDQDHHSFFTLTHPDYLGARIFLEFSYARIHISGDYARAYLPIGVDNPPTITVSAARPPKQIASDIRRRFLPAYLRVWEQCEKARREMEAVFERVNAQLAQLAYNLDGAQTTYMSLTTTGAIYFRGGRFQANFNDFEAKLTTLTFEQALQIVHVLTARQLRWRAPAAPYQNNAVRIIFYTDFYTYRLATRVPTIVVQHKHRTTYYFDPTPETMQRLTAFAERFTNRIINPNGWSAWEYYA